MEGEQGKVLIYGVNNLKVDGLNKGSLSPDEGVEEVEVCVYLPLHGQGSNNDP